ncbi:MAG: GAF domain-containing protein [Paucibacter sp.]|nr:GAF domain-containing protein [Roseateles sp.]
MQCAPIPANESERLAALRALLILDTPPEQRFDRIIEFAREEFEVPIVLLSLVDSERQWFKSSFGLEARETPRDISFCGHAILLPAILVVPDALLDPRFADNPLVTGPPHIRFYAGAPLEVEPGLRIGTLCLISPEPRSFDETDGAILGVLRDIVVGELRGQHEDSA